MRKKSSFYHLRWKKIGINEHVTAEVLGVSVDEVLRWDDEGAPPMAERLLLAWNNKHIGFDGWDGFYFSRGVLRYKRLRWTSGSLLYLVECANENNALKRQLIELESWHGVLGLLSTRCVKSYRRFVSRVKRF